VVDECSMVADDIANRLLEAAAWFGGKLLLVGDERQLPPVGQRTKSVLCSQTPVFDLGASIRFNGNSDLAEIERRLRENPYASLHGLGETYASQDDMHDAYCRDVLDSGSDCRQIYYTRKEVAEANAAVRQRLFSDPKPVEVGEKITVLNTTDCAEKRWYSGQQFNVEDLGEEEVDGIPSYVVRINDYVVPIRFASSNSSSDPSYLGGKEWNAAYNKLRAECKQTNQWERLHDFRSQWIPIGLGYAVTAHRLQGGTVDRSYLIPHKLLRGPEGPNLLYVAATRAREQVNMVLN
jgi:hypothetical protein